jgi:hypothetical protein
MKVVITTIKSVQEEVGNDRCRIRLKQGPLCYQFFRWKLIGGYAVFSCWHSFETVCAPKSENH